MISEINLIVITLNIIKFIMSIDIQIGNNLQSRLKMITITSIYGDNVKEHFPLNSQSTEVVNEMSLIAENFKKQNRGNIQTKDSLYYYRTFVPKVSNEEGEQLFLLIYTDSKYPSSKIDKCFNEINKILSSPNAFAFSLLSKDTKNLINSIFFKYEDGSKIEQVENKDNLIVGSIIKSVDPLQKSSLQANSMSLNFDSELKNGGNEIKLHEDSPINNNLSLNHISEESDIKLTDLPSNIKSTIVENDGDMTAMFLQDNTVLLKVNKWRKIKYLYIILCLLLAVSAYASIPLLWLIIIKE